MKLLLHIDNSVSCTIEDPVERNPHSAQLRRCRKYYHTHTNDPKFKQRIAEKSPRRYEHIKNTEGYKTKKKLQQRKQRNTDSYRTKHTEYMKQRRKHKQEVLCNPES